MITDRLKVRGHQYAYKHLRFEAAGHAISLPGLPIECYPTRVRHSLTGMTYALGGNSEVNAFASEQSWEEVLKFLRNTRRARESVSSNYRISGMVSWQWSRPDLAVSVKSLGFLRPAISVQIRSLFRVPNEL